MLQLLNGRPHVSYFAQIESSLYVFLYLFYAYPYMSLYVCPFTSVSNVPSGTGLL